MHLEILSEFDALMRYVASTHAVELLEVDVTMSQAKVLYMVSANPDMNMSMVATRLGVGPSAVSGLVDRLVEHGYLTRHEDADDRRQHLLALSPKGALVIEKVRELNSRHLERLIAGLSDAEAQALRRGIAALAREARALYEANTHESAETTERNAP